MAQKWHQHSEDVEEAGEEEEAGAGAGEEEEAGAGEEEEARAERLGRRELEPPR